MGIQFKKTFPEAVPVNYGKHIRTSAKVRWYFIVILISIPLLCLLYTLTTQYILVHFSGLVTYDTITLRAPDAGYIKSLDVNAGENVKQGQLLLQFVSPDAEIKLNYLEHEKNRLTELANALSDQNQNALTSVIEVAKQDIESSHTVYERFKEYVKKGGMAELQLEEARRNHVNAQRNLASLTQQINDSQLQSNTLIEVNYKRKILEIDSKIETVKSKMRHFTLRAQKPGSIMHIDTHPGEFVSAGQTLMTVVTQENLNIIAFIDPKFLNKTHRGKSVNITFPGHETITGHIINTPSYAEKLPESQVNPLSTRENKLIAIIKPDTTIPEKYHVFGIPVEIKLG